MSKLSFPSALRLVKSASQEHFREAARELGLQGLVTAGGTLCVISSDSNRAETSFQIPNRKKKFPIGTPVDYLTEPSQAA